MKSKNYQL